MSFPGRGHRLGDSDRDDHNSSPPPTSSSGSPPAAPGHGFDGLSQSVPSAHPSSDSSSGTGMGTRPTATFPQPRTPQAQQRFWCHECGMEIHPLRTPDLECPNCHGGFIEEIEPDTADDPRNFDRYDDEAPNPFTFFGMSPDRGAGLGGGPGGDHTSSFLQSLFGAPSGAAGAGGGSQQHQSSSPRPSSAGAMGSPGSSSWSSDHASYGSGRSPSGDGSGGSRPRGTGTFSMSSSNGGTWTFHFGGPATSRRDGQPGQPGQPGEPGMSNLNRAGRDGFPGAGGDGSGQRGQPASVPSLAEFLNTAFNAPRARSPSHAPFSPSSPGPHSPSAEGRPEEPGSGRHGESAGADNDELAGLRNLIMGLFGNAGVNVQPVPGGMAFAMTGGGTGRGRFPYQMMFGGDNPGLAEAMLGGGRWGDYVFSQQGIDDIITQLMEQANGRDGPRPASESDIAGLERLKLDSTDNLKKFKNTDCPTCKDDFTVEPPEVVVAMPCQHIFHEDCLVPWLKVNGTCPVCRHSIVSDQGASGENGDGGGGSGGGSGGGGGGSGGRDRSTSNEGGSSSGGPGRSPPSGPGGSGNTHSSSSSGNERPHIPGAFSLFNFFQTPSGQPGDRHSDSTGRSDGVRSSSPPSSPLGSGSQRNGSGGTAGSNVELEPEPLD